MRHERKPKAWWEDSRRAFPRPAAEREVRDRFAAEERLAEDGLGVALVFHPDIEFAAQLGETGGVAGGDSIRLRCGSKSCPQKLNVLVSTKARGSLAALLTNTPSGFARW